MTQRNSLRIPFAEWLYRMSESNVPYQARALAVYAVAFKVTCNEELARLVGMDTKGIADKTYNKWKRYLSDNGWVIVKQVTVGRQTTIEVDPAFQETPVTFTDIQSRNPRKFYGSSNATITDTPAVESTVEEVEITDENPVLLARGVENNIYKLNNYPSEQEDRGSGGKETDEGELDLENDEVSPIELQTLEAYQLYNAMAERCGLQQATMLTGTRKRNIKARLKDYGAPKASGLEAWKQVLAMVERSAFMQGENNRRWRANLDFLMKSENFTKTIEGTYGNGAHADGKAAQSEESLTERWQKKLENMSGKEDRQ